MRPSCARLAGDRPAQFVNVEVDGKGCNCDAGGSPAPIGALAALLGLVVRGRRRRA